MEIVKARPRKIEIELENGEIIRLVENKDGTISLTSSNDFSKMLIKPAAGNQIHLWFISNTNDK